MRVCCPACAVWLALLTTGVSRFLGVLLGRDENQDTAPTSCLDTFSVVPTTTPLLSPTAACCACLPNGECPQGCSCGSACDWRVNVDGSVAPVLVGTNPAQNASGVDPGVTPQLQMVFNEVVQLAASASGTGAIVDLSGQDADITFGVGDMAASQKQLQISFSGSLQTGRQYAVSFPPGVVENLQGRVFGGFGSASGVWEFSTLGESCDTSASASPGLPCCRAAQSHLSLSAFAAGPPPRYVRLSPTHLDTPGHPAVLHITLDQNVVVDPNVGGFCVLKDVSG